MPVNLSSFNLVELVQTLKDQQAQYIQATEAITATLEDQRKQQKDASVAVADTLNRISGLFSALVGSASSVMQRSPMPAQTRPAAPKPQAAKTSVSRTAKPGRQSTTGPESVSAFIRAHGGATTAELTKHWQGEGRGGKVENILGPMVKAKRLKRAPNPAGRGSRYTLP